MLNEQIERLRLPKLLRFSGGRKAEFFLNYGIAHKYGVVYKFAVYVLGVYIACI